MHEHKHQTKKAITLMLVELLVACGMGAFVISSLHVVPAKADELLGGPVGGTYAPGACPPAGLGNCDILTFTPNCGAIVTVVGPKGDPDGWGVYQWDMPITEPPVPPYDFYGESYLTNGPVYTHAGEDMVGYAIPSLDPLVCPLPMLIEQGDSSVKDLP
jgi:hypothetical protein